MNHGDASLQQFIIRQYAQWDSRVRVLYLIGYAARGELTDSSDIDILLKFEPGVDPDLFELGGMQQHLTELLRRTADIKTPDMFSPDNLRRVLASSIIAYAA